MRVGRWLKVAAGGVFLLAVAGGAAAWWHHTTQPEYRLRRGQDALRRGDLDRADKMALLLEADGAYDQAHLLRGEMLLRGRRYAEALAEFNQIRDQGDIRRAAAALSGQCLLYLKNPREAERAFLFVLSEDPNHVDAHRGLAVVYYDQGAMPLAMAHLEQVTRLDPKDGRPYRTLGLMYKDLDDRAKAVEAYRAALARDLGPEAAEEARLELAEVLLKQLQHEAALQALEPLGPRTADAPRAVALRAEALWGLGREADARALLDRTLAQHPGVPALLRVRGRLYLAADNPQEAAALLERAVAQDRHDFAARFLLAQAYERLNRAADAAEQRRLGQQTQDYYTEMSKLTREALGRPWDAPVRRRLAEVCQKLDRPELAAMWQEAAAACPPMPDPAP